MSKRIHKFTLGDYGKAVAHMPMGSRILHLDDQCGAVQMWCEIDTEMPAVRWEFQLIYTGTDEVPKGKYLGTVLSNGGSIVRHVYEVEA